MYIHRIKKYLRFFIAGVFLLSGMGHLFDVAGFQNLIIAYGFPTFHMLAPFIVIGEVVIGIMLLENIKPKITLIIAVLMMLLFTGVYTYGYIKHDIRDCGCFGSLNIQFHPVTFYIRNVVLISLGVYLYINSIEKQTDEIPLAQRIIAWTIILPTIFIAGMTSRTLYVTPSHPFLNKAVKETELKRFVETDNKNCVLVSFMSYSCPHCLNSIENYASYYRNGWVDTSFCYILSADNMLDNKQAYLWNKNFPKITYTNIVDSIDFIKAYPTTFLIKNDTISKVVIGELPSPFVLLDIGIEKQPTEFQTED